jgi:hypothetical protein
VTTISTIVKNAALDSVVIDGASLHSAFPGSTGANELSGGSYARQSIVVNPSSGGLRLLNASAVFPVPASTVRWVGFWSGTQWLFAAPNGGATPRNFMSVASTDYIYSSAHGYIDGQRIVFLNGTPPGGITEGQGYYVINASADAFKVSDTPAGSAIDLTSPPSFGCVVCALTESTYPSSSTHTLDAMTFAIPD